MRRSIDYAGLAMEFEKTTMTLAHYLPWYQFDREKTEVGFHWTLKDNGFRFGGDGSIAATGRRSSVPTTDETDEWSGTTCCS